MSTLHFRHATEADISTITHLVNAAYNSTAGPADVLRESDIFTDDRTDLAEITAEIADPLKTVLIAEHEGAVVGSASLHRVSDTEAYFGMFAIDPTRQGSGWGRQVLDEAERFVIEAWGAESMRMTVVEIRTELGAYYARRGFLPTGETEIIPAHYYRDSRFAGQELRWLTLRKSLLVPAI